MKVGGKEIYKNKNNLSPTLTSMNSSSNLAGEKRNDQIDTKYEWKTKNQRMIDYRKVQGSYLPEINDLTFFFSLRLMSRGCRNSLTANTKSQKVLYPQVTAPWMEFISLGCMDQPAIVQQPLDVGVFKW